MPNKRRRVWKVVWERSRSGPLGSAVVGRSMSVTYPPGAVAIPRWSGCRLLAFDSWEGANQWARSVGLRGSQVWQALATDPRPCPYLMRLGIGYGTGYGSVRRWWQGFNDGSLFARREGTTLVYDERKEHATPPGTVACRNIELVAQVWP